LKYDSQSLLSLDPSRAEDNLPIPWPPPGGLASAQDPFARPIASADEELAVPLLALDLEEKAAKESAPSRWGFTTDRAVALSVLLHALLVLLVLGAPTTPGGAAPDPDELPPDLLGLNKLWAVPPSEPPIPIQFYPAPGPKAPAPGANPRLSDLDRRAGGGDPRLPKADTPRSVARPGIQDLDPGKRGPGRGPDDEARAAAEAARMAQAAASQGTGSPEDVAKDGKGTPSSKGLAGLPSSPLREISAAEASRAAGSERRPGGGGDEGGGWESQGGFVDSGPLSFDTKGYEWGPYAAEMIRKIKRNWEIPKLAHYGLKGRLVIRFYLQKDGRVEGVRLLVSSGIPPYDNASMQAIRNSSPFRALPPDFPNPREGVTITFLYNVRPEDADADDPQKAPPRPLLPK
jgi:TonB family protein